MKILICDSCGLRLWEGANDWPNPVNVTLPKLEIKEDRFQLGHIPEYEDNATLCDRCALELKTYLRKMVNRKKTISVTK